MDWIAYCVVPHILRLSEVLHDLFNIVQLLIILHEHKNYFLSQWLSFIPTHAHKWSLGTLQSQLTLGHLYHTCPQTKCRYTYLPFAIISLSISQWYTHVHKMITRYLQPQFILFYLFHSLLLCKFSSLSLFFCSLSFLPLTLSLSFSRVYILSFFLTPYLFLFIYLSSPARP